MIRFGLGAWDWETIHVLAKGLDWDLLNNTLELWGWDLNLDNLWLGSLVDNWGWCGIGQGSNVGSSIGEWDSSISIIVEIWQEPGSWDWGWDSFNRFLSSRGSSGRGGSGRGLSWFSWSSSILWGPPASAWDRVAKGVLASGFLQLKLVGLDFNIILLGNKLLDNWLIVVDERGRVGSGESVWESIGKRSNDWGHSFSFTFRFSHRFSFSGNKGQNGSKDQLK